MSTIVDSLPSILADDDAGSTAVSTRVGEPYAGSTESPLSAFATAQVRGLIRQVFVPGWPRPSRQVVFSAVDSEADVLPVCMQVGRALAEETSQAVCVVSTTSSRQEEREMVGSRPPYPAMQNRYGMLRDSSVQLAPTLWSMSRPAFAGPEGTSAIRAGARLAELGLEFEYTILQAAPVSADSSAVLLGRLCGGLVLVLEANTTRRVAAQKTKQMLSAAGVRLLGAVLIGRTFPVPESIYKRL